MADSWGALGAALVDVRGSVARGTGCVEESRRPPGHTPQVSFRASAPGGRPRQEEPVMAEQRELRSTPLAASARRCRGWSGSAIARVVGLLVAGGLQRAADVLGFGL